MPTPITPYDGVVPNPLIQAQPEFDENSQDAWEYVLTFLGQEINQFAADLGTGNTNSTSVTSNTIGTGSKAFIVDPGKAYFPGQSVTIASTSAPTNRMFAVVDDYDSGTGAFEVTSQAFEGSGTFTDWTITLGFNGVISEGQVAGLFARNFIEGLNLLSAVDTDHDITIAEGKILSSDNLNILQLALPLTKRIDAAWAVGDNNGGLFSGTVANSTTYHLFLIKRSDTGVVDAGWDTSITAANIPSPYDSYRRIGSFKTDGSANLRAFLQRGNGVDRTIEYITSVNDIDQQNPGTSAVLRTLSIPADLKLKAKISAGFFGGTNPGNSMVVSDPDTTDSTPQTLATASLTNKITFSSTLSGGWALTLMEVYSNTSSQIRTRLINSGASDRQGVITWGYTDSL